MHKTKKREAARGPRDLWIVFTGLIRRPDILMASLAKLEPLLQVGSIGGVVLSTWRSELERYPELRGTLERSIVRIIEADTPMERGEDPGNVRSQHLALHLGLSLCPKLSFVLRTRPDSYLLCIDEIDELIAFLKRVDLGINDRESNEIGPHEKIWVGAVTPHIPFLIEDRYFFGSRAMLRTLASFSHGGYGAVSHPNMAFGEARWFSSGLENHYPFLYYIRRFDWLRALHPRVGANAKRCDAFGVAAERHQYYWDTLATYHAVLQTRFSTGIDFTIENPPSYSRFNSWEPDVLLPKSNSVEDYLEIYKKDARYLAAAKRVDDRVLPEFVYDEDYEPMFQEFAADMRPFALDQFPRIWRPNESKGANDSRRDQTISFDAWPLDTEVLTGAPVGVEMLLTCDPAGTDGAAVEFHVSHHWMQDGEIVWWNFPWEPASVSARGRAIISRNFLTPHRIGQYQLVLMIHLSGAVVGRRELNIDVHSQSKG